MIEKIPPKGVSFSDFICKLLFATSAGDLLDSIKIRNGIKYIMDNYEKQVYIGRELFLKYDQDKLIKKYGLKHDEEYLYLKYIGTEYRINRRNGAIEYATGEEWTDCREYTVVMTIYDFLCRSGQEILVPPFGSLYQYPPGKNVCHHARR